MKKLLLFCVLVFLFGQKSFSQNGRSVGPAERRMTDSLCSCVVKIDLSKITNKTDAMAAYTSCVEEHLDILKDLADERKVNMSEKEAMEKIGVDLAINLLGQECKGFKQLALIMGGSNKNADEEAVGTSTGKFKRIDNKGFNYIVITGSGGNEKSFLWLRQFPGSENFMNGSLKYIGKNVTIKYQEIEVYLPQARGYYRVKEITSLDIE
jgi:23S rRNA pseudoU1915 N3-methylase RlmH